MNIKHNKKRNTAFLYEILVREVANAVYNKQNDYKKQVMEVLINHFSPKTELVKDYQCYKGLYEYRDTSESVAQRLITEISNRRDKIDQKKLFNEQTKLINTINKQLNDDVWDNFVPEYRFLGTLYQYFNMSDDISVQNKVMLEESITKRIISENKRKKDKVEPIDSITYNIYVKKFNEHFGELLNERQKNTIKQYIFSIKDSGVSFKNFLNEEIAKLKKELKTTCDGPNSVCDVEINQKINKVSQLLESYSKKPVKEEEMVPQILKIQKLISEMNEPPDENSDQSQSNA